MDYKLRKVEVSDKGVEFFIEFPDESDTLKDKFDYLIMDIKRILSAHPFLWCYAKADQMVDHRFNDDVALCYALTRRGAWKKIFPYYGNACIDDIHRVHFNQKKFTILTDY